jgi:hypothetical protein
VAESRELINPCNALRKQWNADIVAGGSVDGGEWCIFFLSLATFPSFPPSSPFPSPPSLCSTVNDLSIGNLSTTGLVIAALSVASSGLQQIMCGHYQRKHGLTSIQMLSITAPVQASRQASKQTLHVLLQLLLLFLLFVVVVRLVCKQRSPPFLHLTSLPPPHPFFLPSRASCFSWWAPPSIS